MAMTGKIQTIISFLVLSTIFLATNVFAGYEKEIDQLSSKMAGKIDRAKKQKIAVVDFTDIDGNTTALGRFLAEEFSVAFASTDAKYKVVDRTHLKSILKEHKLAQSGFIDPATARKLGKIVGVEALITGNLTAFGDSVRLSLKILDTETAEVIGASRLNIAKTQVIEELLSREIEVNPNSDGKSASNDVVSKSKKKFSSRKKRSTANDYPTVLEKEIKFSLRSCKRAGTGINCTILFTSLDNDKSLYLYGNSAGYSSRLFDEEGQVFSSNKAMLGGVSHATYVSASIPKDIPTKAVLSFSDVPLSTTVAPMLDISLNYKGYFKAQFRNITIEESP